MAKKSKIVRNEQRIKKVQQDIAAGRKPKHKIRVHNRCKKCGRPRGYLGLFGICRICFRELASNNLLAGVTKSSW